MTTWRKMFEATYPDLDLSKLVFNPRDIDLDREFNDGYGCIEGQPFYAYSDTKIYYCWEYDGSEGIGNIPRHPDDTKPTHT